MLAPRPGRPRDRGIDWLLRAQETDGSWFGRWGVNHVYGTGAACRPWSRRAIPAHGR
jgi:squalene-hopene/tetraprenyl-beta-curcumene cyclase